MVARQEDGAKPTRRWKFSAKPPQSGADELSNLLWTAGRAYNEVLAVAREGQREQWAVIERHAPGLTDAGDRVAELTSKLAAARQEVEDWRQSEYQRTGKKTRATPGAMKEYIDALIAERRESWAKAKELRTAFYDRIKPWREREKELLTPLKAALPKAATRARGQANEQVFARIEEECTDDAFLDLRRAERAGEGLIRAARKQGACVALPPLMFDLAVERVKAALQKTKKGLPGFRSNDGTGEAVIDLKVNTAKGLRWTWADLWRPNSKAWLRDDTWSAEQRGKRRQGGRKFAVLMLRVGSRGTRKEPVFAEIPIMLHREPPPDTDVKRVALVVTRIGRHKRYEVQFVVQHEAFTDSPRPHGRGTVRVEYGWEKCEGGIRVAKAIGDDGWTDELILPSYARTVGKKARFGVVETIRHADVLKSARKRIDNKMLGSAARREDVTHEDRSWGRVMRHLVRAQGSRLTFMERATRSDANHARFERVVESWCKHVLGERLGPTWKAWVAERKRNGDDLHAKVSIVGTWANGHGLRPGAEHLAFWCWCWLCKTRHLEEIEKYHARRGRNRRKELVREWAIRLATRYEHLERNSQKFAVAALRRTVEDDDPGKAHAHAEAVRLQRWIASPGEARAIVCQVFGGTPMKPREVKRGDRIVEPLTLPGKAPLAAE